MTIDHTTRRLFEIRVFPRVNESVARGQQQRDGAQQLGETTMNVKPRTHGWIGVTKNKIGSLKTDIAISVSNPFPF